LGKGPKNVFVAVESVYSMDGDICPLRDIVETVEEVLPYGNGHVVIDEAHGTGVLGPKGRGLVSALGLEKRVFARLHTFGKGVGASGGMFDRGLGIMLMCGLTRYSDCVVLAAGAVISYQLRPAADIHDVHAIHQPCCDQGRLFPSPVWSHRTGKLLSSLDLALVGSLY